MGDGGPRASRGSWRWLATIAFGLLVVALLAMLVADTGHDTASDALAGRLALGQTGLAHALGGAPDDYLRSSPPVDLETIEHAAAAASAGRIPMPTGRHMATYRDRATDATVTEAVLVYKDPAAAAGLDAVAAPLLGSTFGLMSEPIDLPGAADARLWRRSDYLAVTFRVGGLVGLVGTTAAGDDRAVLALAGALRDTLGAAPTPTAAETAMP
jgi:hypothetical protein